MRFFKNINIKTEMKFFYSYVFYFLIITPSYSQNIERLYTADQGNGFYKNPILTGKAGDPSVVRVGENYYMTHSGGDYPSLPIWQSKDLVNWQNIGFAYKGIGNPWAPDLVFVNGVFYIYVTIVNNKKEGGRSFENYVLKAENPAGPWSEPIDLKVPSKIDPGHIITPDGKRYLYFDKGYVAELSPDGTKRISEIEKKYDGWEIPKDWFVECFCLESPKLFKKGDFYYLISAEGGTTGPATSHLAVVARSKSPLGPWENSPLNPLIHTQNRNEKWWSQGHATLIEHTDGSWWAIYHSYENSYRSLGRQTLLLPVEWTTDGWPKIKNDIKPDQAIIKPFVNEQTNFTNSLSDDFSASILNKQWRINLEKNSVDDFAVKNRQLTVKAKGEQFNQSSAIYCMPRHHAYEVAVKATIEPENEAAITIASADKFYGIILKNNELSSFPQGSSTPEKIKVTSKTISFKLLNLYHDLALFYSLDGKNWIKMANSFETSALSSVGIYLLAKGKGNVIFENFKYKAID